MSEGTQNVQQQSQDEQALQDARDFFGQSMGRILGQMESDYAQLQSYMQQLPDDTQAPVQQMTDSYNQFAGTITQAAQDAGVQDSVLESAQQARQNADQASEQGPTDVAAQQAQQVTEQAQDTVGQVTDQAGQVADQAQDTVGGLTDQAQDAAGQATDQVGQVADQAQEAVGDAAEQAQDVAGQMAGSLPEGYEALGPPVTEDQGNQILQGQDEEGNTAIVRRATDEAGGVIDSIFDAQGNLLDENIIEEGEEAAEEEAEAEEEPQDLASQMAQALPEGYQVVGDPTTDEEGNRVIEAQDEQGNRVTIRREIDEQGNVVDRVYDAEGN